ncbi:hypothetical protein AMJ85_00430 [candidate division BRC1 bacterium SM23_51]|nr:MAG: hypothetical protein AMJ85_00430 [candidate division BRC1 bacterium SM23_51]
MGCPLDTSLKGWEEAVVQRHGPGTPSGCNNGGFSFPGALPQAMTFLPFRQIAALWWYCGARLAAVRRVGLAH